MRQIPLLSLILEYLEENNRLSTIDDADGEYGQTPLWFAYYRGSLEAARLLLDRGHKGRSTAGRPLHVACLEGHDAVVKLLLLNGANKNRPEADRPRVPSPVTILSCRLV